MICQPCQAATLAEAGVVVITGEVGDLHSRCDEPGSGCSCPCEYAQGSRCTNCGRARHVGQLEDGECIDRADCAQAIVAGFHAGRAAPQAINRRSVLEHQALVAAGGPSMGVSAFIVTSSTKKRRDCKCGCGETTGGGLYRPGHDARHVSQLTAQVRGGTLELEAAIGTLDSDKLRAKLTKAVEG